MIGKLAVSGSFAFVYMYSAELFPTQVRNIGAGVVTIGARVGGFFSPIVLLAVSIDLLPCVYNNNYWFIQSIILAYKYILSVLIFSFMFYYRLDMV